jgi:hypothetical protein
MVISDEVKFPRTPNVEPFKTSKKVEAVDGPLPIVRIGAFKREWSRRRGEEQAGREREAYSLTDEETIKKVLGRVNASLEEQHILLHLVLIKDGEDGGYQLDVYDCTGTDQCRIVKDIVISLEDLPILLRNLEDETGILVDTIS